MSIMQAFPSFTVFKNTASEQTIEFFPEAEGSRFAWRSEGVDKLGTYCFDKDHLEISFNYAREERYLFTVLQTEEGEITHFRLKDRWGRETEFRKA